jgi:hypothetical protein
MTCLGAVQCHYLRRVLQKRPQGENKGKRNATTIVEIRMLNDESLLKGKLLRVAKELPKK